MKRTLVIWLAAALLAATACSSKDNNDNNGTDTGSQTNGDIGTTDDSGNGGVDGGDDVSDSDAGGDLGSGDAGSECLQVSIVQETFGLPYADDVSVEYEVKLEPEIDERERELALLFERYGDATYVGTFELGTGADANFGTCAHCLYIRGNSAERAYFADRGTLTVNTDPFARRIDVSVENLRLIEVGVDPFTRESAPIPFGTCIEVADFTQQGAFPVAGWTCDASEFNDGTACHCDCGAVDPDCGGAIECLPGDPGCTPREELPVENCEATELCAFEPISNSFACTEPCDWLDRDGCSEGTCVFGQGGNEPDLCIADGPRVAPDVQLGEACPEIALQVMCNVVDGFAEGYCGPNGICRPICQSDDECPVEGETCRYFNPVDGGLGYCGPEPVDG